MTTTQTLHLTDGVTDQAVEYRYLRRWKSTDRRQWRPELAAVERLSDGRTILVRLDQLFLNTTAAS